MLFYEVLFSLFFTTPAQAV